METILLIDYSNFAWKGCVDFKNQTEPSYTVVFNFFRNIKSLIEQFYPKQIFLCGEGGRSFRHRLYSEYKANRIVKTAEEHSKQTLDSFYRQSSIIWDLVKHLPLRRVFADGFEGDDVICTLAYDLKDEDIIIISNDTDYIQLLQKDYGSAQPASIFNPFTREYVEAPFYHYLTYKVCAGDIADNIPKLVSPKKAVALATDPKALAKFLSSSEEYKENYNLNKSLIELNSIPLDKLTFMSYNVDYDALAKEFALMRFHSILKEYQSFIDSFKQLS